VDVTLSAEVSDLVTQADEQIVAVGALLLIVGIAHVIGSIGVFAHRRWGRAFGLVLGVLGILAGVGIILAAVGVESIDVGLDVAMEGEEGSVAGGLFVLVTYLLIFLGVLVGRGHFKRKGVEG
jgi:hypothetical protein